MRSKLACAVFGILLLGPAWTALAALDPSLVAWWAFDDGQGTVAVDGSHNGNDGTLVNSPTWVAGTLGGALRFNGSSAYVRAPHIPFDNRSFTIAMWFNPAALNNQQTVFSQTQARGTNTSLHLRLGGPGATYAPIGGLRMGFYGNDLDTPTGIFQNSTWYHLTCWYDYENRIRRVYVNGVQSAEGTAVSPFTGTTGNTILGSWDGTEEYFNGILDDVRVYKRPLTVAEIANVMKGAQDGPATSPTPQDKATDLSRDVILGWKPGPFAGTHNVYFGTDFSDVNTATTGSDVLVSKGQDANTYDPPGRLSFGVTYYWRVDEVNASADHSVLKGDIWQFAVEPYAYAVKNITATASASATGSGPENTINGSGLTGDQHGTNTAAMWSTGNNPTQPIWIRYDFDRAYKLFQMLVWNHNTQFESLLGFGIKDTTIEYSADGANWTTLGDYQFTQATASLDYVANTTVDLGGKAVKAVKITAKSNYGGKQYGLSEVRFLYVPVQAREPVPAVGATGITPDVTVSWRAGREAASHQVYMGTDPNALTLAGTVNTTSYAASGLNLSAAYYWRVDEVNTAEAIATWAGDVWSFTTNPYIVVDDMEGYNDSTSMIFNIWVDGYGTLTNGSLVGLNAAVNGTFGSTTTVHAGKQSMPLAYGNTGSITNSEATRTFDSIQDWTNSGVKALSLYFYGQSGNTTTVPFWVRLTDQSGKTAKVTFGAAAGEDPIVLADPAWTTWNIPLASFTGITLSKIKSMTIGLGNGTGSGTLYIDDIRLYPAVTITATPATLVGWWKLDNDVKDSSGTGNHGTIVGTPTYMAAGKIGASLRLNGTTDYIDCGNAANLNMTDVVTLSAWIKPSGLGNSAYQTFISKGDHAYVLAQTNVNQLQLAIYDGTWYSANSAAVTGSINGSWHHVAGTYDGTQVRLYVDGKMAASTLHTGVIATDTYVLSVGRNSEASGRLFVGEMDDVRVYHGVLPTSEIVKLANP